MEMPRWKHMECNGCKYIISQKVEGTWVDRYECGSNTTVLRYGDDDGEAGNYIALSKSGWRRIGWWGLKKLGRQTRLDE